MGISHFKCTIDMMQLQSERGFLLKGKASSIVSGCLYRVYVHVYFLTSSRKRCLDGNIKFYYLIRFPPSITSGSPFRQRTYWLSDFPRSSPELKYFDIDAFLLLSFLSASPYALRVLQKSYSIELSSYVYRIMIRRIPVCLRLMKTKPKNRWLEGSVTVHITKDI